MNKEYIVDALDRFGVIARHANEYEKAIAKVKELEEELQYAEEDKLAVIEENEELRKQLKKAERFVEFDGIDQNGNIKYKELSDRLINACQIEDIEQSFENEYGCLVNEIPEFMGATEAERIEKYKEYRDAGLDIRDTTDRGDGWLTRTISVKYEN